MFLPAFVCLSVSKITQKRLHGFGWNVACRQKSGHGRTDYLLSPIRIIVRMPEPDCFLRYRISAATRNCTSGKSHVYVLEARRCSEAWFYLPSRRNTFVGGTCGALYWVPFYSCTYGARKQKKRISSLTTAETRPRDLTFGFGLRPLRLTGLFDYFFLTISSRWLKQMRNAPSRTIYWCKIMLLVSVI